MSLDVSVGLKDSAFRTGLAQIRNQAAGFTGSLKGMLTGALGGFGAAFSLQGIIAFADRMRDIRRGAAELGTSVESFQRIGAAAKQSDVDVEPLARSLGRINTEAAKAAGGDKGAAGLFTKIGVDAKAFVALSMDQKLIALSGAYRHAQSSAEGNAAVLQLIGERGREIIPVLERGPAALARGMQEATVQSRETVNAFATLSQALDKIKSSGAKAFANFAPSITQGVAEVAQNIKDIGAFLSNPTWKNFKATLVVHSDQVAEDLKKSEPPAPIVGGAAGTAEDTTKLATLKEQIAQEEARNRADALSGEAKINELIAQRADLSDKINEDTEDGLNAKKQALALDREIAEAQKSQKQEMDRAQKAEAGELEKQYLAKASPREKAKFLAEKRARLMDESEKAERSGDEVKATEKRTAAEALDPDIAESRGKAKGGQRLTVSVDSLQRAGGGGGIGPATDPLLRATEKQTQLLQQIKDALTQGASVEVRDPKPLY